MPGDKLAELAKTGELELMYVHLQSMWNFGSVLTPLKGENAERRSPLEAAELTTEESLH